MPIHIDRWRWLQLLASEHGPPGSTTRHVLHAISVHMNAKGENAWPSKSCLAARTALSERAVTTHTNKARKQGWIEVTKRRQAGRGWQVNQYRATVPDHVSAFIAPKSERRERSSPRADERREPHDITQGTSRHNAGNEVPTNSSLNKSLMGKPPSANNGAGGRETIDQVYGDPETRGPADKKMVEALNKIASGDQNK